MKVRTEGRTEGKKERKKEGRKEEEEVWNRKETEDRYFLFKKNWCGVVVPSFMCQLPVPKLQRKEFVTLPITVWLLIPT